ncbi:MAG: hypothetical protein EOP38_16315 [Rubrivivax sp.]|nr:MAG: hypothetical protein EOP38_16315 [Rubrivivax sp.]
MAFDSLAATQVQNLNANTRYPIVLSHHYGGTAKTAFYGDWVVNADGTGQFKRGGIKEALEQEGASVAQPDKIPFGDHKVRGALLYKKCEVTPPPLMKDANGSLSPNYNDPAYVASSLSEALCLSGSRRRVDGVEKVMDDHCRDPAKIAGQYSDYGDCIQRIKVNIICHSQGCPDSRYMISAMTNELSHKPMADHVASWTSLAGANKGTLLADLGLGLIGCPMGCADGVVAALWNYMGVLSSQGASTTPVWNPHAFESVRALTRRYMTVSMDDAPCPASGCGPSFNQAYPNSPKVYYQTYSLKINRLDPCDLVVTPLWTSDYALEGSNDGLISVDSQRFATTGYGPINGTSNVPTHVVDRGLIQGTSTSPLYSYPGVTHMGVSTQPAAGLAGPKCAFESAGNASTRFSRVGIYLNIVHDLKAMGF